MKIIKSASICVALLVCLSPASFSMDASSVHIAVLENGTIIKKTPFASRVRIFAEAPLEKDAEFKDHGVRVSSVLVGEKSVLPPQTNITLVPTIDLFASYLQEKKSNDLVILN